MAPGPGLGLLAKEFKLGPLWKVGETQIRNPCGQGLRYDLGRQLQNQDLKDELEGGRQREVREDGENSKDKGLGVKE